MSSDTWKIVIPETVEQAQPEIDLCEQAFQSDPEGGRRTVEANGPQWVRLLQDDHETVAGLYIIDAGQWFGGQRVSCWGICGVVTATHRRGEGGAHYMMSQMVREAHAKGVALSTLYPATVALYRKSGYELAGRNDRWALPVRTLGSYKAPGKAVPFGEDEIDDAMALYRKRATHGNMDRNDLLTEWKTKPHKEVVYRYFLVVDGERCGYMIIDKKRHGGKLLIRDLVTLNPAAKKLAVSVLISHRTMYEKAVWAGSPHDLQLFEGPMFPPDRDYAEQWMMRICHIENALTQRGYRNVTTELHLQIDDDIISENAGRYVLSLRQGKPTVQRGGDGHIRMHVRSLAPLFSSLMTAEELAGAGVLEGDADQLAALTLAFSGPQPWIADSF